MVQLVPCQLLQLQLDVCPVLYKRKDALDIILFPIQTQRTDPTARSNIRCLKACLKLQWRTAMDPLKLGCFSESAVGCMGSVWLPGQCVVANQQRVRLQALNVLYNGAHQF
uniref:Uncharacterized protein n=1 Tax=Eutreptiella gymnastica TaxID=73025 RepID=A0A7S4D1W7_9EUGL